MALPADGRMDMADTVQIGNSISVMMAPAFVKSAIFMNLVVAETCSNASQSIKFRKSGSLIAESVAEGAVYIPSDANSDINDTSVTVTAAKVAVLSSLSVEAMRFGGGAANVPRVSDEQGRAIARQFDAACITLIDSVTNVATATSTMDTDTLFTGQMNIENANCPPGSLVAVMSPKQANELRKLVANSGASIWNSQYNSPLFGAPQANNFIGNFLGIDIYQTTGLTTTGGDTQGVIFNPNYAFAAAMGGAIDSHVYWSGAGVASQVPGFCWVVDSHMLFGVGIYNDTALCELRSDT